MRGKTVPPALADNCQGLIGNIDRLAMGAPIENSGDAYADPAERPMQRCFRLANF